jgi:putative NADPH-quinone reductase
MKVVAILGTYRKGGVTDSAVDAVLAGAQSAGAQTDKIYLIDKHIEFCDNCRACCQKPGPQRGKCGYQDDMASILDTVEGADAIVFAGPMNAGYVTAVTKKFIERMLVYYYWPWGKVRPPKPRSKEITKKAIIITSSTMPAILGRIMGRHIFHLLHAIVKAFGAKPVKTLYFGMVAPTPGWKLPEKQLGKCRDAGRKLAAC